jgi:hypothetical protein
LRGVSIHLIHSRSVPVGLVLFTALCVYVPWRNEPFHCAPDEACGRYYRLGYDFIFSGGTGTVDLQRWGLEVLALAALVALSYSGERRT